MALPKLNNAPNYEMEVPSTGKKVRFRPFLVREQKALLIAAESKNQKTMFRSVLDVLLSCVEDDIRPESLTSFDVEYMFMQMRAKSVGETATIGIKCSECGHSNEKSINLEQIQMDLPDVENKIQLTPDISLELNYPSYLDIVNSGVQDKDPTSGQLFDLLYSCIRYVETPDERINIRDVSKSEVKEFVDSMNAEQFQSVQKFVMDIPRLQHKVSFTCKGCNHANEIDIEGISNFLS